MIKSKWMKKIKDVMPAHIEMVNASVKKALEKIFVDMLLDVTLNNSLPEVGKEINGGDSGYVKKIISLHANISDSLLCMCVLLLCNFRALEPIEKKLILRRIVVVCHELYKYIYGFTKKKTGWDSVSKDLETRYPDMCACLIKQGEKYLKKYAQSEDKILRDVSNHYSDNPFVFYKYISSINEKGVVDRALMMLSIALPLSDLLLKELNFFFPKVYMQPYPDNGYEFIPCRYKDIFNDRILKQTLHSMKHRKEMARKQIQALKRNESFCLHYNYDITHNRRWKMLKDDNVVLHVIFLQLDIMVLSLAMGRAETSLEEKIIMAYMIASMHESFKKIYGFSDTAREKSLWHRYAETRLDYITDSTLLADIKLVSGTLDAFAKQEYLRNPTVALFLSHVGYVKDLGGNSSNAMLDYLLKDDQRMDLVGVVKVISFLNILVNVSGKLLSYENDVMDEEKKNNLKEQLEKIEEIERKALRGIKGEKAKTELRKQIAAIKDTVRMLYNWD